MRASDWMRMGAIRFGECVILGAIVAAGLFAWNRYLLRLPRQVVRWVSLPAFLMIVASSLIGAVRFVWTRPFM